jgi:hypothetical protein
MELRYPRPRVLEGVSERGGVKYFFLLAEIVTFVIAAIWPVFDSISLTWIQV